MNLDVAQTEEDAPFDLDTAPPETPIPDVDEINVSQASDDDLEDKLEDYKSAGATLILHHEYMRQRFDLLLPEYVNVYAALDALTALGDTISAVLPVFELQEGWSIIPEDWEDIKEIENIVKQGLAYGSLAIGVPSSGYALYNAWQKSSAAAEAHRAAKGAVGRAKLRSSGQLTPIRDFGPGYSPRGSLSSGGSAASFKSVKSAKTAATKFRASRVLKGLGAFGAVVGVGVAGYAIYLAIRENQAEREFLETSVSSFASWYAQTLESHTSLRAGVTTIENELRRLMLALGIESDEDAPITEANVANLRARLEAVSTVAGRKGIMVETATRIFCRDKGANARDVASLTGLTLLEAGNIGNQINGTRGDAICALIDPPPPDDGNGD